MDEYAEVVGHEASNEDYMRIATYFSSLGNHFKAGQFFIRGKYFSEVCVIKLQR